MTEQRSSDPFLDLKVSHILKQLEAYAEKQRTCEHDWKLMSRSVRNGWKVSEWHQCQKCGANK